MLYLFGKKNFLSLFLNLKPFFDFFLVLKLRGSTTLHTGWFLDLDMHLPQRKCPICWYIDEADDTSSRRLNLSARGDYGHCGSLCCIPETGMLLEPNPKLEVIFIFVNFYIFVFFSKFLNILRNFSTSMIKLRDMIFQRSKYLKDTQDFTNRSKLENHVK